MQRQRINLDSLLQVIEDSQLTNFVLLVDDYGKEYSIEQHTTNESNTDLTIDLIRRRVLMYPKETTFKIVLKPSPTANGTSIRTYFFSRTTQNEPTNQPQNTGLGSVDNSFGLGAIERMIDTQNQINRKEWEVERKSLLEDFSLKLEKDRIKQEKEDLKEEKRIFENDKKNAVAKKIGEGLGAFALNYAKNNPQLGALLSSLEGPATGLGSTDDDDDEDYNPKSSILEDLKEGILTIQDLEQIIQQKKYAYQSEEEETEY
jgi:hypothetical protein